MKVTVRFFAMLQEITGRNAIDLELPPDAGEEVFWHHLLQLYPQLKVYQNHVRLAINRQYVPQSFQIQDGDEICMIPPVSGG